MALIALDNEQKNELKGNDNFRLEVEWAALSKASYWSGLDGSTVPGNDRVRWARSRFFSAHILQNPSINLEEYVKLFLVLLTGQVYDDANPFVADDVVDFMKNGGYDFFEAVMDQVFEQKIKTIIF